ncbi:hypothetical protein A2U01_0074262 [Trifolium medium]|uniref:Uncharacterized protein n=1 Tax=Trifolium medium TaxID=97028 RepID=A0A392SYQ3_9FABA|nr:hypothetical protein [Trifolium medium]
MAAVQDYRAQTPTPSYYRQYPQQTDLTGHFQRQTTRLLEHQNHVHDIWSQDYQAHHPPQQSASDDEMDCEIDTAFDLYTAPGGSSQGGH